MSRLLRYSLLAVSMLTTALSSEAQSGKTRQMISRQNASDKFLASVHQLLQTKSTTDSNAQNLTVINPELLVAAGGAITRKTKTDTSIHHELVGPAYLAEFEGKDSLVKNGHLDPEEIQKGRFEFYEFGDNHDICRTSYVFDKKDGVYSLYSFYPTVPCTDEDSVEEQKVTLEEGRQGDKITSFNTLKEMLSLTAVLNPNAVTPSLDLK